MTCKTRLKCLHTVQGNVTAMLTGGPWILRCYQTEISFKHGSNLHCGVNADLHLCNTPKARLLSVRGDVEMPFLICGQIQKEGKGSNYSPSKEQRLLDLSSFTSLN